MDIIQNEDYFLEQDWFRLGHPTYAVDGLYYTVVTDLASEPIDLDFLKKHCRIDFNTDDDLLTAYLKAARQYLEGWSQLSFGAKTINFKALKLPTKWELVNGPYNAITTVGSGFTLFGQTLIYGDYRRRTNREIYEVDLTLTTVWNPLPESIKIAIAKQAAWMYISRESIVTSDEGAIQHKAVLDDEAKILMQPYRAITWP